MKQFLGRFPLFCGLVFMVCAVTACKTNPETRVPRTYKVVGIDGDARYFENESNVAHHLRLGDRLAQGVVIQTANGIGNVVMLVSDETGATPERTNPRPYDRLDKLVIYENSVVKIDKLNVKTVGGKKIRETRLVLATGAALCDTGLTWPTDNDDFFNPGPPGPRIGSIHLQPNASYFEIGTSNMLVHAEHAVFFLSRGGIVRVLNGAVALEFHRSGMTKDLFSGQQYDSETGEITRPEVRRPEWPGAYWNWLRPNVAPHEFQVPQRPF